ncbi:MAG TPA: hypothetical protein VGM88_14230 [Kofleriaceae bacterium]
MAEPRRSIKVANGKLEFRVPRSFRAGLAEVGKVVTDPPLLLWSAMLCLLPFYVVPSGLPQPGDFLLILLAPIMLVRRRRALTQDLAQPLRSLWIFVAWVVVLNFGWSLVTAEFSFNGRWGFLMAPTFYIYNAILFLTFLLMYAEYGYRLLWVTARVVLISLLFQTTMSLLGPHGARDRLYFNNANQLGYYALLCACVLLLNQRALKLSTLQVALGLLGASFLTLTSGSRAALGSIAMLAIALVLTRFRTMLVAGAAVALLLLTPNPLSDALQRAEDRIDRDESAVQFEERGYDRILAFPEYWGLGAGEGGYERFRNISKIGAHELHASMATLFFCYGIVGVSLFAIFLWRVVRRSGVRTWLVVGPGFAYGMTHQGLRVAMLWVLLGMAVCLRNFARQERGPPKPSGQRTPTATGVPIKRRPAPTVGPLVGGAE